MCVRVAGSPVQGRPAALLEGERICVLFPLSQSASHSSSTRRHIIRLLPVLLRITHLLYCVGVDTRQSEEQSHDVEVAAAGRFVQRGAAMLRRSVWRTQVYTRIEMADLAPPGYRWQPNSHTLAPRASLTGVRQAWRLPACGQGAPPR